MRLSEFFRRLLVKRYSGTVVLHFQNGTPKLVEIPNTRVNLREDFDKAEVTSVESQAT